MDVTSDRNLTSAPRPGTWARRRALAILVEPDRWRGRGIIAHALTQQPAICRRWSGLPATSSRRPPRCGRLRTLATKADGREDEYRRTLSGRGFRTHCLGR